MKITGYGSINTAGGAKKPGQVSPSTSFSDLLALSEGAETHSSAPVGDLAATAALNNLLVLQEISEEEIQRRKLAQRGKGLLEILERLRLQLLAGAIPHHVLRDLGRQLSIQKQFVNDDALNAVIEDIELRAAVELAKLEKAFEAQAGQAAK